MLLSIGCNPNTGSNQNLIEDDDLDLGKSVAGAKAGMVEIPGGLLNMGGDNAQADQNEFPKHQVAIDGFWMDETEVTNTKKRKCSNWVGSISQQL